MSLAFFDKALILYVIAQLSGLRPVLSKELTLAFSESTISLTIFSQPLCAAHDSGIPRVHLNKIGLQQERNNRVAHIFGRPGQWSSARKVSPVDKDSRCKKDSQNLNMALHSRPS